MSRKGFTTCAWTLFAAFFVATISLPQQPEEFKVNFLTSPNDAYALALAHCNSCPEAIRRYLRYVWITEADTEDAQAISLAINLNSRSGEIVQPAPIGHKDQDNKYKILLACIDIRNYAPRADDRQEWFDAWEDLQFDPALNRLLTKDTLRFAAQSIQGWKGRAWVAKWRLIDCAPYVENGKTFNKHWAIRGQAENIDLSVDVKDVELIRFSSPVIDPGVRAALELATHSDAPLVTHPYYVFRGMASIQDKGLYATIYGGRYYQFAGIKKGNAKGTDEENFLEKFAGIGNVQAGVKAKDIFDALPSDKKAAKLRSDVTGSPRGVEFYKTLTGPLVITRDLKNQSVDIGTHPIANLIEFKHDGSECLFAKANGLQGSALFNADGGLVDEVPPDIAKDHTVPQPHTARLQSIISCIACHWTEGSDGWKLFSNDVKTMADFAGYPPADISNLKKPVDETNARIRGLYRATPKSLLMIPRDELHAAVLETTGAWKESKDANKDAIKFAGAKLVNIWRKYYYEMVDAEQALKEVWIKCDKKDAQKVFNMLLAPDQRAAVGVREVGVIIPQDPRITALRAGIPISRIDWNFVHSFVAETAHFRLTQMLKEKK